MRQYNTILLTSLLLFFIGLIVNHVMVAMSRSLMEGMGNVAPQQTGANKGGLSDYTKNIEEIKTSVKGLEKRVSEYDDKLKDAVERATAAQTSATNALTAAAKAQATANAADEKVTKLTTAMAP